MNLQIELIEIISQAKETGASRETIHKRILNPNKDKITKILYKLSRKNFIYYRGKKWFLDENVYDLAPSDIWRLIQIPFERSNYFYFYRKDWQEKVSQKKVYS